VKLPQSVYFIKPIGCDSPIKIGASNCVEARLIELDAGSPLRLELLAQTPNVDKLEARLHALFHGQRCHGEWFHSSVELLSLIDTVEDGSFSPASIPAGIIPDAARRSNARGAQSLRMALKRPTPSPTIPGDTL